MARNPAVGEKYQKMYLKVAKAYMLEIYNDVVQLSLGTLPVKRYEKYVFLWTLYLNFEARNNPSRVKKIKAAKLRKFLKFYSITMSGSAKTLKILPS